MQTADVYDCDLSIVSIFQVRFVVMSFLTNCLVDGIGKEGKGGGGSSQSNFDEHFLRLNRSIHFLSVLSRHQILFITP